ncbi:N-acetylaspartate synthetase-like [Glandiceps talaboti]
MSQQVERSRTFKTEAGDIVIRSFTPEDDDEVKAMFVTGMKENTFRLFKRQFKLKSTWLSLLAGMIICRWLTHSFYSLLFVAFTTMVVLYILSMLAFKNYFDSRLQSDLKDINTYYMNKPRHHFWVAQYKGTVIGSVCVREDETDPKIAELLTMSVKKEYRRFGIGKSLLNTVIDFARRHGYQELFLSTLVVMEPPRKLYEGKGFQLIKIVGYNEYMIVMKVEICFYSMTLK